MGKEMERGRRRLLSLGQIPNPVELFGYKISFLDPGSFRYLCRRVSWTAPCYFQAETETPLFSICGSNIGMSILFFKKLYPKARIVAFEPDPFTFAALSTNISQNHLSEVQLHQAALGKFDGEIEFFRDACTQSSSLMMSTVRERHDGPSIEVPALKLSTFITSAVDLLKIDVEGAEFAVLTDLANAGKLRFIRRIHLEYHHHIDHSVDNLSSLLRLMEEHGFGYQLIVSEDLAIGARLPRRIDLFLPKALRAR